MSEKQVSSGFYYDSEGKIRSLTTAEATYSFQEAVRLAKGRTPFSGFFIGGNGKITNVSELSSGGGGSSEVTKAYVDKQDNAVLEEVKADLEEYYNKEEVERLIGDIATVDLKVVESLPIEDISKSTIYFVKKEEEAEENVYNEYLYINDKWELIGDTKADLSGYVKEEVLHEVAKSGDYEDLLNKPLSLPANGGNADTVDGKHADDFVEYKEAVEDLFKVNPKGTCICKWDTATENTPLKAGLTVSGAGMAIINNTAGSQYTTYFVMPAGSIDIFVAVSVEGELYGNWTKLSDYQKYAPIYIGNLLDINEMGTYSCYGGDCTNLPSVDLGWWFVTMTQFRDSGYKEFIARRFNCLDAGTEIYKACEGDNSDGVLIWRKICDGGNADTLGGAEATEFVKKGEPINGILLKNDDGARVTINPLGIEGDGDSILEGFSSGEFDSLIVDGMNIEQMWSTVEETKVNTEIQGNAVFPNNVYIEWGRIYFNENSVADVMFENTFAKTPVVTIGNETGGINKWVGDVTKTDVNFWADTENIEFINWIAIGIIE